jgi:hypothetical protein
MEKCELEEPMAGTMNGGWRVMVTTERVSLIIPSHQTQSNALVEDINSKYSNGRSSAGGSFEEPSGISSREPSNGNCWLKSELAECPKDQ